MDLLDGDAARSPKRGVIKPDALPRRSARAGTSRSQGAAEDAQLGVSRRARGRRAKRPGGTAPPTYLPVEDDLDAAEEAAPAEEALAGEGRAQPATPQSESLALAMHLDAEPTLVRPTAAVPDTPDPEPERERIEEELGLAELAASLEEYGTPPVAPPAERVDRSALERELLSEAEASESSSGWKARRALRHRAREEAASQAETENERLIAEQQELQSELDARCEELQELRERAEREAAEWANHEAARREAARSEQQAALDREWQRLIDADSGSVTATLRGASSSDDATTVLGFLDRVAVLIVRSPARDEVIAETEPAITSAGRRTTRARPETRRNALYLAAVASRVLEAVGRALMTTPAVEAVTCVAVQIADSHAGPWEPIYVGTFERAYAERLHAEGRWSADPDALVEAVEQAEEVDLEVSGPAREIAALDVANDPGLKAVMAQLDPAIRSDENLARRSDQKAVKTFLDGDASEPGNDSEDEEGDEDEGGEVAKLEGSADVVPHDGASIPQARSPEGARPSAPGAEGGREEAIAAVGQPTEPGKGKEVTDARGGGRAAASETIGPGDDSQDTQLLLRALSDPDDNVRLEAMYALKDRLLPDMRRDALVRACSADDELVRRNAIEKLAELRDERDTPLLLQALDDRDEHVRLEAIYAVKHRLQPHMRDALIKACRDSDSSVRRKAFETLAELGDERDTQLLLKGLKDPDSIVRMQAVDAIERRSAGSWSQLNGPLLEAMKDEDAKVRQLAVRLFGRLQQPAVEGSSAARRPGAA